MGITADILDNFHFLFLASDAFPALAVPSPFRGKKVELYLLGEGAKTPLYFLSTLNFGAGFAEPLTGKQRDLIGRLFDGVSIYRFGDVPSCLLDLEMRGRTPREQLEQYDARQRELSGAMEWVVVNALLLGWDANIDCCLAKDYPEFLRHCTGEATRIISEKTPETNAA